MELIPLKDYVLVTPIEENKVDGDIRVEANTKIPQGKVISFGVEVTTMTAGDIVVFNEWAVTKYGGYYLIKEEDILCLKR